MDSSKSPKWAAEDVIAKVPVTAAVTVAAIEKVPLPAIEKVLVTAKVTVAATVLATGQVNAHAVSGGGHPEKNCLNDSIRMVTENSMTTRVGLHCAP